MLVVDKSESWGWLLVVHLLPRLTTFEGSFQITRIWKKSEIFALIDGTNDRLCLLVLWRIRIGILGYFGRIYPTIANISRWHHLNSLNLLICSFSGHFLCKSFTLNSLFSATRIPITAFPFYANIFWLNVKNGVLILVSFSASSSIVRQTLSMLQHINMHEFCAHLRVIDLLVGWVWGLCCGEVYSVDALWAPRILVNFGGPFRSTRVLVLNLIWTSLGWLSDKVVTERAQIFSRKALTVKISLLVDHNFVSQLSSICLASIESISGPTYKSRPILEATYGHATNLVLNERLVIHGTILGWYYKLPANIQILLVFRQTTSFTVLGQNEALNLTVSPLVWPSATSFRRTLHSIAFDFF